MNLGTGSTMSTVCATLRRRPDVIRPMPAPQSRARFSFFGAGRIGVAGDLPLFELDACVSCDGD